MHAHTGTVSHILSGPEGTYSPESREGLVAQGNQVSLRDLESLHCPETGTPSDVRAGVLGDPSSGSQDLVLSS